jgi:hypothetical protein
MCGEEGPVVMSCRNGHKLHPECQRRICTAYFPNPPTCPMCRDETAAKVAVCTCPSILAMGFTPYSTCVAAAMALRGGCNEYYSLADDVNNG